MALYDTGLGLFCIGGAASCTAGAAGCVGGADGYVGGTGVPHAVLGLQVVDVVLVAIHQPYLFMS